MKTLREATQALLDAAMAAKMPDAAESPKDMLKCSDDCSHKRRM